MRLLGDVRLIENEKLAPPTDGASAARANQASKFEIREYGDHWHCSCSS